MQITKSDVIWSYAATFLKIASTALLLPFILFMMPSETVGIWSVFMTITALSTLLDFGFSPSFTRNVTYIFSGVKSLKRSGFEAVDNKQIIIDFGLLKGVISAMRWFYLRMALILFILLATFGSYYIHTILLQYTGDRSEVYVAWFILCIINTYNLFTLYYDALLQGKGLIKKSKQIIILGQSVYLVIAIILIIAGNGLIAIISAQAASVIMIRWLSYRSFFTNQLQESLKDIEPRATKEILKAIYPNSIKIGLTALGGILVNRSAIIIGSLFLTLNEIASYAITLQLISIISGTAGIYIITYQPKIAQLRIEQNHSAIKKLYLTGQAIILLTYLSGGICLLLFGNWALELIGSQTELLAGPLIALAILISYLENHHATAASILLSKNEVPFFKASLISGAATVLLLLLFFNLTNFGLWVMIASQGIAQGAYQNWKWPLVVVRELNISRKDLLEVPNSIINSFKNWLKFT